MYFPFELPNQRDFDVVGFGTNAVDFLIQVPEYPTFNSKIELNDYTQAAGGEVASTMAGLQRLGCKTAYVGRFGDDDAGRFGLQSLADDGVDVAFSQVVPRARTQIAFIIIDERSGERTVIWKRDAHLKFHENEVPTELIRRSRILHCTPHDAKACIALAREARKLGVIVSTDIDNAFDGIEKLLHYVDILIASEDFPGRFLGIRDSKTAIRELSSRYGCSVTGITRGEAGSLLLCADTFIESRAFAVPGGCKDTTGAGDAFRVGLLFGLLNSKSVEESADMANAVASLKCRKVGARTALPTQLELEEMLQTSNRLTDAA